MKPFMNRDFLLKTETAKELYHDHAAKMPIIDYHCHINPMEIYEDRQFTSITDVWLGGDHYKWRAMRSCGVPEYYVTGGASAEEKFQKWAESIPQLIGNPLYHWTHLELQRYFDVTEPLTGKNAMEIYEHCNKVLQKPDMSVRGILRQSNVVAVGTTDDPIDDLEAHRLLAADPTSPALVMPSFRPDKAMRADKPDFPQYLRKLEAVVGYTIDTIDKMRQALLDRIDYFASRGCRISDHGLDYCFYERSSDAELTATLTKARDGKTISLREQLAFHTDLMLTVGREYHRRNWVMQLHFGCLRNNSAKMFELIGADTGFDSINDAANGAPLAAFLSQLEKEDCLPKTILYSLNPADNGVIGSMIGCFQTDGGISGKIQQGSAWWFNDHKDGMETQMRSLMSLGAMGTFNGMLTDSRSFLSYTRHEYFRRILCNLFGTMVEDGEYPADMETLNRMVENICYHNAVRYFDLVKDLK